MTEMQAEELIVLKQRAAGIRRDLAALREGEHEQPAGDILRAAVRSLDFVGDCLDTLSKQGARVDA